MRKIIANPQILLVIVGLMALILGILSGDVHRVMVKGATVCLECIGLG